MKIDLNWLESTIFQRNLTSAEQSLLLDIIKIEHYHKGDTVIIENQQGKGLYFLREGNMAISLQSHGENVRICKVSEGAQLGDFASFAESTVSASVTSLGDSTLYHISHQSIDDLMKERSDLCWDLLINAVRNLSAIVHDMNKGNALARQSTYGSMA